MRSLSGLPFLVGPLLEPDKCRIAWSTIRTYAGTEYDGGRRKALETLVECKENLRRIDLRGAPLDDVQAEKARLNGVIAWGARLVNANLQGAELSGALLQNAYLQGANLSYADLSGAILQGAEVSPSTNFDNSSLFRADLRSVKKLECSNIVRARNWETAWRDERVGCGQSIPTGNP